MHGSESAIKTLACCQGAQQPSFGYGHYSQGAQPKKVSGAYQSSSCTTILILADDSMSIIGPYQVEQELGRGAMGVVFRGYDRIVGRRVALKVLLPRSSASEEEVAEFKLRLVREATAIGKLSHPNIVSLYHVGEERGLLYLALEYVAGVSLEISLREGPLKPQCALNYLGQIADALDHAHRSGIIHRDVKPANVLIARDGIAKLTDFGIAHIQSQTITRAGITMGTPAYMAPEQILAMRVDGRSDQFSLASMAYQMLAGSRPFEAITDSAVMLRIVQEDPAPIDQVNTALPQSCRRVFREALAKQPESRYATCNEFVQELEECFVAGGESQRPGPVVERPLLADIGMALAGSGGRRTIDTESLSPECNELQPDDGQEELPSAFGVACTKHPERIGSYRILRELGRGGMGIVYLAVRDDGTFTKRVALKIMLDKPHDREALERFRSERQVLAALDHPNITRILDAGDTQSGAPYYAMEYIEGEPLDSYCNRKGLDLEPRLRLFQQVCSAVKYLHSQRVLHRDLKPTNILVNGDGVVKLLDFGIAKFQGLGAVDLTTARRAPLTPGYASPEQLAGNPVGATADVYALGAIVFHLLTGELPNPLKPQAPSSLLRMQAAHTKRRIAGDLDMIVLKALALDPDGRYASAEELSTDIDRFFADLPILARKSPVLLRLKKLLVRNRSRAFGVAAILLIAVAAISVAIHQARERHDINTKQAQLRALLDSIASAPPTDVGTKDVADIVEAVRKLRHSLESKWVESAALTPDQAKVRAQVLDRSRAYLDSLRGVSERNPTAAREIGYAYIRLGELGQLGYRPDASRKSTAVASYSSAAATLSDAVKLSPGDLDIQQRLAEVERRLADLGAGPQSGLGASASPESSRDVSPVTRATGSDAERAGIVHSVAHAAAPRQTTTVPVIDSFQADASRVRPGQAVRLHWVVHGEVTELSLEPGGELSRAADSLVANPADTTTYVLTAKGRTRTVEESVTVEVIPFAPPAIERLVSEPAIVAQGQSAKLIWATSGDLTAIAVSPGPSLSPKDTALEVAPDKTTEYTLHVSGPAGKTSKSVSVEVVTPPEPKRISIEPLANGLLGGFAISSPRDAELMFSAAQEKLHAQRYEEAAVLFGKAARIKPGWKDPLIERGKIDNKLGRFREAIEDCNQALLIDDSDPVALNQRGLAHHGLSELKAALADYDAAIRLRPEFAEAYVNRGNLKFYSGDRVGGKSDFEMARSLQSKKHKEVTNHATTNAN